MIIYLLVCVYLIVDAGHDDGQVLYEPQGHDHHVDGDEDVVSIRTNPSHTKHQIIRKHAGAELSD